MTYTKDNLRQIFQQPFNMNEWQQMLQHYFQATELRVEPERIDGTPDDEKGFYLGYLNPTDGYRIGLFYYEIQHGNVARKRVGLRNLVHQFIHHTTGDFDAALVVFNSKESVWRLSFICDIKGEATAPKRFSYVFGESDNYYNTPVGRFDALQRKGISFDNIKDAFSVEALSKEFFDEYREHYADIVEYITGKRYVKEKGKWVEKTIHEPCHEILDQFVSVYKDPEKTVRDYIKKLMGRLVFLQFLQKKEWLGVPADHLDWKGGDTRFLQNKFNEFADKDNFIDGFLEPLFNDLNTNRQESGDLASPKVGNGIKIPFLNGGLFQLDEEDCSSIRLPQHLLGDVLDFFERYNFTIDENDPNDAQVGVDPEMLGRVFENLLEDNKDKGAFYTPKEIVQYMCQESLIAYLQTGVEDETIKESIRQFVLTHEAEHLGSMAEDISIKLLNVKICDPAIGRGAFPMGLLRQLYLCQCAIHPELEEKNAADIKRHIIQNNIYGVDIEKGAVDIARLRFWLSLIVDEETPRFLPNLDFKIMQGNSLLEQYKGVDLSKVTEISTEQGKEIQLTWFDKELDKLRFSLRERLNEYYNCSDHQRKEQLEQEIIDNVKQQLREQRVNVDFGDLDLSANDQFTLWHTWFYDVFSQGGFDIVIANPPYVNIANIKPDNYRKLLQSLFYSNRNKSDLYSFFIEKGFNLLNKDGVQCYIVPHTWKATDSFKNLREIIFKRHSMVQIVNQEMGVFDAVVNPMIILLKNIFEEDYNIDVYDGIGKFKYAINVREIKEDPNLSIDSESTLEEKVLFKSIEKSKFRLSDVISFSRGIKTSDDKRFITTECVNSEYKKVFRGRNIKAYSMNWAHEYIWYRPDLMREKVGCLPHTKEYFEVPEKLITQRVNSSMQLFVAYDNKQNYFLDTTNVSNYKTWNQHFSLKYICGVLNSKVINYWYPHKFRMPTIGGYELNSIPIPEASKKQQQKIVDIVDSILSLKELNSASDTSSLEAEIDSLVYHLYGLTYDEVLIVDPETPITREEYENE